MLNIMISSSSNLAIYEQIMNQVKTAIINKDVVAGDALPSIRALARDLQISVITTKRAYEELEKEGLIFSKSGKGFYVNEQNTNLLKEKKITMIESHLSEIIKECKAAGLSLEDIKDIIDVLYQESAE